jgi:hypothetical protein
MAVILHPDRAGLIHLEPDPNDLLKPFFHQT